MSDEPQDNTPVDTPIENTQIEDKIEETKVEEVETPIEPDKIEVQTRNAKVEPKEDKTEDDTIVDPKDAETITKFVDKALTPIQERLQRREDEFEVNNYIQENPEFAKYKGAILKHVSHPDYKNIPLSFIAAGIARKDLLKIGAQKEREAQEKANLTKNPGDTVRKTGGGAIDWSKATSAELAAKTAQILGHSGS